MRTNPKTFFDDLVRVEIAVWEQVDRRFAADAGAPVSWYETLEVVILRAEARVQDVAETLLITPGAASKLVDRIVDAGHVRRVPHSTDGRSFALSATASGRALHAQLSGSLEGALAALDAELPAGTLDTLAAALTPLRELLLGRSHHDELNPSQEPA